MSAVSQVRLDTWLWAARFFKTRALAAQAVDGGKVELNGARLARAPFSSTLPPSTACAARARVLKKRAAQSQVSRRTCETADIRSQTSDVRLRMKPTSIRFTSITP